MLSTPLPWGLGEQREACLARRWLLRVVSHAALSAALSADGLELAVDDEGFF